MKNAHLFWSFIVQTFIVHFQRVAEKRPKPVGRLRRVSFALLFGLVTASLVLGPTIVNPQPLLAYSASAQAEPDPVLSGVVGGGGAQVWEKVTGELVTELLPGAAVTIYTRSDDDRWLFVEDEQLLAGWTPSDAIIVVRSSRLPSEKVTIDPVLPAPKPSNDSQSSAVDTSETTASTASISDTTTSPLTATVITEDSRLNVRSGAGSQNPVVAKALPGERYIVLDKSDDGKWIKIELSAEGNDEAETGWVSADYVSLGNSAPSNGTSSSGASSTMKSAAKEPNVAMAQKIGGETASQSKNPTLSVRPTGLGGKLVFQNRGGTASISTTWVAAICRSSPLGSTRRSAQTAGGSPSHVATMQMASTSSTPTAATNNRFLGRGIGFVHRSGVLMEPVSSLCVAMNSLIAMY